MDQVHQWPGNPFEHLNQFSVLLERQGGIGRDEIIRFQFHLQQSEGRALPSDQSKRGRCLLRRGKERNRRRFGGKGKRILFLEYQELLSEAIVNGILVYDDTI